MATSGGDEERSGLGKFVKSQAKYGTTTKQTHNNETFIKHTVEKCETLQGIALKHGVTMEQIKRANNIWTNDSLFLREFLLIPLEDTLTSNGTLASRPDRGARDPGVEIVTRQEMLQAGRKEPVPPTDPAPARTNNPTTAPAKKDSAHDFLSRFDSSLAQIKHKVKELDDTSQFPEDQKNPLNHLSHKSRSVYGRRSTSRGRHRLSHSSLDGVDPCSEPDMVFRSRTHPDSHVQTSLDRLEQTHDSLYQL